MALNRQRAKQRQAERRAERLAERQGDGDQRRGPDEPAPRSEEAGLPAGTRREDEIAAEVEAGAPREDLGRSDTVVESPPPPTDDDLPEGAFEEDEEGPGAPAAEPAVERDRGRVLTFLAACWAELQRVQWPNRKALTQLTGVVLFFVLIAGGYLGLLDAIFSRIIQAIL